MPISRILHVQWLANWLSFLIRKSNWKVGKKNFSYELLIGSHPKRNWWKNEASGQYVYTRQLIGQPLRIPPQPRQFAVQPYKNSSDVRSQHFSSLFRESLVTKNTNNALPHGEYLIIRSAVQKAQSSKLRINYCTEIKDKSWRMTWQWQLIIIIINIQTTSAATAAKKFF